MEMGTATSGGKDARQRAADEQASRLSIEIERTSPEGRPAHPTAGRRTFAAIVALIAMLVVSGGVLVGLLYDATTGLFAAAVGALMLLVNPEMWAGVARVRERERIRAELMEDGHAAARGEAPREAQQ